MRFTLFFIAGVLVLSTTSSAQDTLSGEFDREITLQEAINIVLENSNDLQIAAYNVTASEYNVRYEKTHSWPSVTGTIESGRNASRQFVPGTDNFVNQAVNSIDGSLQISSTLFNGFENRNSLQSSNYDLHSNKANRQWVRETVIFETANLFLQVILSQKLYIIAKENLKASKDLLKQVQAQVDIRERSIVDLYKQRADVASKELDVANQNNNRMLSRADLIQQLQIDPFQNYKFTMPPIEEGDLSLITLDLKHLYETALAKRSDLQSQKYQVEADKYQLKAAKGALYPSLNLGASLSSAYGDQFSVSGIDGSIPFGEQFFDDRITNVILLSLTIPFFNAFESRTNVQLQEISYKSAQLNAETKRLQVFQQINKAYNNYKTLEKHLESTEIILEAAGQAYQSELKRYGIGEATLIELHQANTEYVIAQINRTQAEYNFVFQKKLLDYYTGELSSDFWD